MLSFGEKEKTGVPGKNLLEASGGENRNKKKQGATLSSSCGRLLLFLSGVKTFKVTGC